MSIKTWGIDVRTNKLVNIHDITKEDKKYIKCTSPNCTCTLIPNMGEKKDYYFRHPANTKCSGGSAESVLHKLCKDTIFDIISNSTFSLPSSSFNFNNIERLIDNEVALSSIDNVHKEEFLPFKVSIKPDIWFEYEGTYFCIEIVFTHDISRDTYNKYKSLTQICNLRVYTIDVGYLKDCVDSLTTDIVEELLYKSCRLEISNKLVELRYLEKVGTYKQMTGNIICPVTNSQINTRSCNNCCFHISTKGGIMSCGGNGCYRSVNDFFTSTTRDERRDIYYELVPKNNDEVEKIFDLDSKVIHPFGYCSCGKPYILARGDSSQVIRGIKQLKSEDLITRLGLKNHNSGRRDAVYRYCSCCGNIEPIICKKCGSPMKVWRNLNRAYKSYGSVFIGCSNKNSLPGGSCDCDTLTLFTDDTCLNYADELKSQELLDNWFKGLKKFRNKLDRVRGKL